MNKVNQDIIKDLTRLFEIEQQQKKLKQEYKLLEDKIHLTFDSAKYDTLQAEKHIINKFWSRAYDDYLDGGYITNDQFIVDARFEYEKIIIQNLVNQNVSEYKTCLDIGCGNGRYTKFLSTIASLLNCLIMLFKISADFFEFSLCIESDITLLRLPIFSTVKAL